jgi:acyl-CoA synthetase (AMP-forming)/AMP-acid ligase II
LSAPVKNTTTMAPLKLPGLDLTILEAIQHNETQNPDYPIFRYDNEDSSTQSITWSEAGKAFTRASHFIVESLSSDADVPSPRIVGMLANLDSITFFSIIIGILRAGCVPFLISTRNSPEAIAHLMASVGSQVLLLSEGPVINELAGAAIRLFKMSSNTKAEGSMKIQTILAPSFEQLYGDREEPISRGDILPSMASDTSPEKWDRLCIVAHSSGTTSLPKPISLTHRMVQQHASMNREC